MKVNQLLTTFFVISTLMMISSTFQFFSYLSSGKVIMQCFYGIGALFWTVITLVIAFDLLKGDHIKLKAVVKEKRNYRVRFLLESGKERVYFITNENVLQSLKPKTNVVIHLTKRTKQLKDIQI